MRSLINSTFIAKLKPGPKQYDVRDTKLKGFLVRVNPTGKMNFVCEYRRGRRINIGRVGIITPSQARDKAMEILADANKGLEPNSRKVNPNTTLNTFILGEYTTWFETHRKSAPKTLARLRCCFLTEFGDLPMSALTVQKLENWRSNKRKQGRKVASLNGDIATLKAALSKAVEWNYISENPIVKMKLLRADKNLIVRYLSPQEEQRLSKALDARDKRIKEARNSANQWRRERGHPLLPDLSKQAFVDHLKPMVILSMNTGIRQGALFSLRWSNVDFDKATLTIQGEQAKSGSTRHIPLNSYVLTIMRQWKQQSNSITYVFPGKANKQLTNVRKAWKNLLIKAKITHFRWHDLRHHFASKLVMNRIDLNTVRELLGHSDMKMTLRYAHLAPEHKALAVEKLVQAV